MDQENGISLDTAAIVSIVLEGILYGISIMMFIGTAWALVRGRTHSDINMKMITVACLMLLLSTAHLVIDIIRTWEGLVLYRNSYQPGGPIGFFSDVSQWSFVYKNMIYMLQTLVGDGVVIYRCYVFWKPWWVIIFPVILWVSVGVTGFGCVYYDSQATVARENVFAPSTGTWITAFLANALFTNIVCTAMLAFRIWKAGRGARRTRGTHASLSWPILRILLDAGVLYSVSLLALLSCFVSKNRGHYVILDMSVPIISITFYVVIIRIAIAKSTSQPFARATSSASENHTLSPISRRNRQREHPMKHMEVHITQLTETNERGKYADGSVKTKKGGEAGQEMGPLSRTSMGFAV